MESRTVPLRVVIAGAGKMAGHHVAAVTRSRQPARIVAVADPDTEARRTMLQSLPGVEGFASLEAALGGTEADVVHVCTPPSTHADMAVRAVRADCHVYVEKPFAATTCEARRVFDAASERGVRVCAGHQLLFERPATETWDLLPALGDLQHIESYFAFRPVRGRGGQAPVREDEQLLDVLPHPVYVLLEAFERAGEAGPASVVALEVGAGTVHALIRRGELTGSLVVTLTGRPVDSYLRLVGTNGSCHADFVRGIVRRQVGPGFSGIDKLIAPYREARQLALGTTVATIRRVTNRKRSYPGLQEIFEAFYDHIRGERDAPMSINSVLETVRIQEKVASALRTGGEQTSVEFREGAMGVVLVTGGTGFLGTAVVESLRKRGRRVRVLARREPPAWRRVSGVEYVAGDLSDGCSVEWFDSVTSVIHCAAATSGGWPEHQATSIDATKHLLDGIAAAGCARLVHVSSVAVLEDESASIDEGSSYLSDSRASGPYAWGKLESERLVRSFAVESRTEAVVVRPGAIVDYEHFDPPGRLGKRLGNLFVAVGGRGETMGVVDLSFCGRALAHLVEDPDPPSIVHLLDPDLPTRGELVAHLKRRNPDLRVVWIPRMMIRPLGLIATGLQKVMRPRTPPVDIASVFANRRYETSQAAVLERRIMSQPVGGSDIGSPSTTVGAAMSPK